MAFCPTPAQKVAVDTRDRSVFLSAAAGSGKTAVLTERVIAALTDENHPLSLSRLLAVTFTESAAAELRSRIGDKLADTIRARGGSDALARELRLLPAADISTIDAFCHKILRRFGTHRIPEGFRVTDEAEAENLRSDLMEEVVEAGYAGALPNISAAEFSALSDRLAGLREEQKLSEILLSLYGKLRTYEKGVSTLDDFAREYREEAKKPVFETRFGQALARLVRETLSESAGALLDSFETEVYPEEPSRGDSLPAIVRAWSPHLAALRSPVSYTACREAVRYPVPKPTQTSTSKAWKPYLSGTWKSLRKEFTDALSSLKSGKDDKAFLLFAYTEDDWHDLYLALADVLSALSRVLSEFDRRYYADGVRRRAFDFSQLERATYDLLVEGGERTALARSVAAGYDMVCVDEYQDVSPLQHAIFDAVSEERNRFFVGDIKQSIYRFRHAEPDIFTALRQNYPRLAYDAKTGERGDAGDDAPAVSHFMGDNFRCDREIVSFVNTVFSTLFGTAGESIGYEDSLDRLRFSKSAEGVTLFPRPQVVIIDSEKGKRAAEDPPEEKDGLPLARDVAGGSPPTNKTAQQSADGQSEDADEAVPDFDEDNTISQEALWVAREVHRLLTEGTHNDGVTPYRPSDIVLLSRKLQNETRPYERALAQYGIPVSMPDSENFFENPEVLLAVGLLSVIDNPLRDIPLAGVLCSPLYGFTPDELSGIRRETRGGIPLYDALTAYCAAHADFARGQAFLSDLASFRKTAEDTPVSHLIRRIYSETPLLSLAGADGRQGDKNLKLLYHYACTFAGSDYEGLNGFLRYILRQSERGARFKTPAGAPAGDAVRILSIHASKGLEFPVVFLVGCGKAFSRREEQEEILCDSRLGVALKLGDLSGQLKVDNPIRRLFALALREKSREEEMRLLYVALTRARERLYVTGEVPKSTSFDKMPSERAERAAASPSRAHTLACESYLEWMTFVHLAHPHDIDFTVLREDIPLPAAADPAAPVSEREEAEIREMADTLRRQFAETAAVTHPPRLPRKLAVSALTPRLLDGTEAEETPYRPTETVEKDDHEKHRRLPLAYAGEIAPDPTERGIATHQFLQFCDFRRLAEDGVARETERLIAEAYLSRATADLMRPEELEAFRASDLFRDLLAAKEVRREFRFHMFLPAARFTTDEAERARLGDETLFIQGVMDALIESPDGSLSLVDYKTDRLTREELANPALAAEKLLARHSAQMRYYAAAVERIFGKPPRAVLLYSLHAGRTFPVPME